MVLFSHLLLLIEDRGIRAAVKMENLRLPPPQTLPSVPLEKYQGFQADASRFWKSPLPIHFICYKDNHLFWHLCDFTVYIYI